MNASEDKDNLRNSLSANELGILLEICQALHQTINLDDLLTHIASKTKRMVGAETVAVILHDPSRNELFFRMTEGNPQDSAKRLAEIRFPTEQGIAGSVFRSGKPEVVLDVSGDPRHFKGVDKKTSFKTDSMVAVPLRTGERIIGVLEACNKINGVFNAKDLDLLVAVSGPIAMALDNARIHSALEKAYQELQLLDKAKDDLIEHTRQENARLRQEVEGRYRFDAIRGNSPQMLEVFRFCEKIMDSDITVLIEGETGTGKELIARCLHYNGPRKHKPFVTQNCGGIPESLLSSELFGHKRGAFTGAISDKKGLFEIANGGTVFLDEVAEMSPTMQVNLLRVLQEGEIKPLGSNEVKKVDVRILSATNRSLEDDVQKGLFRQDLFYRLSVVTIHLPPLREREGDIPILAEYFLKKFNRKMNKSVRGLSKRAEDYLCSYYFPGNIRELENEIERAVVLAEDGKCIQTSHLSEKITKRLPSPGNDLRTHGKLKDMVQDLEKTVLTHMIEEHAGNKSKIAKQLGLSRFGLQKKMKRYGFCS